MSAREAKYTRLPVRTLGPGHGLTLEQYRDIPEPERPAPSRGSRLRELVQQVRITEGWQTQAACKDHPEDMFFATSKSKSNHYDAARVVCGGCPVQVPCLEFALRTNEAAGLWGGKTKGERDEIRSERRRRRAL